MRAHPTDSGESQALSKQVISAACFCRHDAQFHMEWFNGGTNAKGCRYVCTKNGCNRWSYCDLKSLDTVKTAASERPDDKSKAVKNALNEETEDSNV